MKAGNRIRTVILAALACLMLASGTVHARSLQQKKQAAAEQFTLAERMREALEGKPESRRTRRDFQHVIDAYRKVYYTAPSSNRADKSVLAVAELMDEQGRILNDPKSFQDAIAQLEFLRREYPGRYRIEALFTIAEIYRDDLNDTAQARATFQEFVKQYPHVSDTAKARAALKEMDDEAKGGKPARTRAAKPAHTSSKNPASAKSDSTKSDSTKSGPAKSAPESAVVADSKTPSNAREVSAPDTSIRNERHSLPLLTKVRYWSTPDYTRVAIDLDEEVKYEAGRVPHPDRIFFDLHGTRLASDMVGKSFDVEDGF
ncbi:MAG TPA: tetratricopeptide repeat protein, partial [Verrucomicrobiae bacterium]|nr:tetratricopeptide repeat protein [Verrucomicrobiae bacterium]